MRKIAIGLIAVMLGMLIPGNVTAAPDRGLDLLSRQATSAQELQAQIDQQLKLAPGGKQISANEVSYDNGRFVVTYALPGQVQLLAPDCPSGWFCFYDLTNFRYPRGRLSDFGEQDLATWGWRNRTESVHNNTNTDVDFDSTTQVHLFCVDSFNTDADVAPHRNDADFVFRFTFDTHC